MKDFPGQGLFPGSRSSRLKVCSRFAAQEDEVSPLLLAGDLICCAHTLPASGRRAWGSSISSTSSREGSAAACRKGQGAGRDPGWAASWLLASMGSEGAAEDTVKPGSGGKGEPSRGRERPRSHLGSEASPGVVTKPPFFPRLTRVGCGLELRQDAQVPFFGTRRRRAN